MKTYQDNPEDNDAKSKIEFTFFNDATGQTETHTPTDLEFVFGSAKKLDGLHTYLKGSQSGIRIEYDREKRLLRYITGIDYTADLTAYIDFGGSLAKAPEYLIKYKGMNLKNFNYTNIDENLREIFVTDNGRVAFKILKNGEPANDAEAQQNP